jgi:c-di-GMP-binding flagellar brake protein YcgR
MGKNIERDVFEVGLALSIESHYKTHLATRLLGWDGELFLMTNAIYIQGRPAKLKKSDPCTVRFLKDGVAYGFGSEIISVQFFPFPLMFLRYPADVELIKIRVSHRHKVNLPAVLSDSSGAVLASDAVLLDISEGGCALKVPVAEGVELPPDAEYAISFRVLDRDLGIGCRIRKMDKRGKYAWFLGMEFAGLSDEKMEMLNSFVEFFGRQQR